MKIRVRRLKYVVATIVALLASGFEAIRAQPQDEIKPVIGTPNNQFRVVNTYPEYWVDGQPFIMHGAAFFYHRIPRDRWVEVLLHLKSLGINTIDLYPLWNWQQPEEGVLDFDGHTNPRRDLKYLLRLIDLMDFKLTFRPGPYLTDEWRNGGYPDWLLRRPEYGMSDQSILEGRYPLWSQLQYDKSEEAATKWMQNQTHLDYTRRWFHDVFGVANPLLAEHGGPLINIQIDDDQALGRENYNGPAFWKYMDLLRTYAKEATHNSAIPYYINGADMRLNAESNDATIEPFWNTGQDYQSFGPGGYSDLNEAAKNKFLTETLKTQPLFPATHIEFLAGWDLDDKDTYARLTHPSNTLMAMRVMLQNGLKGLSHHPANDTLYPAGYECPWANYFYTQENAITFSGGENGRAAYIRRTGRLIDGMGPLLAPTHLATDAGIVYPMATYPQPELTSVEIQQVADVAGRLLWSGAFDHYNFELIDSDHTPLQNFERYRVLLLPNPQAGEDAGKYPHLGEYSEKAQRMIVQYVNDGGTLIVLHSRPGGAILGEFLSPLGPQQFTPGTTTLHFTDGSNATIVGGEYAVTPAEKSGVTVFARDTRGQVVGARFPRGKGQVLFFGGDFSRWVFPPGTHLMEGGVVSGKTADFPESVQLSSRMALPALMKAAAVDKKVSVASPKSVTRAREAGMYVTELVADRGSHSFETRTDTAGTYGFVGLTNFSIHQPYRGELSARDPRSDVAQAANIRLPDITLGPRESLLLPLRVPLATLISSAPAGLDPADEVYYSTAELTHAAYDGSALKFDFNSPSGGEIALRLAQRPRTAQIDGNSVTITQAAQHLLIVKIPKGIGPEFKRALMLEYRAAEPRLVFHKKDDWITGETNTVRVTIHNPRKTVLSGDLMLLAGRLANPTPVHVEIPPQSSRLVEVPLDLPLDAPDGLPVDMTATLRAQGSPSDWTWHSGLTVHQPFTYSLTPVMNFPLREDQSFPLVHPYLASINLPGEAVFHLKLKNWRGRAQRLRVGISGTDLTFTEVPTEVNIPANGAQVIEFHAVPTKGSGLYQFSFHLSSGSFELHDAVVLTAIEPGKALAYEFDYDRDGFPDVILENQKIRCFVSPHAGGRSFALVLKDSNHNAFNSVGGMRDMFAHRVEPKDLEGLNEYTRMNWMGLTNRPYTFQIMTSAGTQAKVKLEYEAPDVYPAGAKVERILSLPGDQNIVIQESTVTPRGIEPGQAYVLENSVSFQQADQAYYRRWFMNGKALTEFLPEKELALENPEFFGTLDQRSGESFAIMLLTPPLKTQLQTRRHSGFFRIRYPDFTVAGHGVQYRVAYYFGKESPARLGGLLKTINHRVDEAK
jgi:glycosyl hydrolase family 35